jgi:enoyl-CoA hydratase/carnithine racemase
MEEEYMTIHGRFAIPFVLLGLTATGGSSIHATPAAPQSQAVSHAMSGAHSSPATALRQDMRKLWSDHVIWTRQYIVAAIGNSPDQQAAATRLLKNQEDIGAAVAVYYGNPAGDRLTALLKEHITIAVDLVNAAKAHDDARYKSFAQKWQQNGDDIAAFLSGANPNWPKAALVEMMRTHLSTTTNEVVARLNGRWDEDVAAFDEAYAHILRMSDALAEGIIRQFPAKF